MRLSLRIPRIVIGDEVELVVRVYGSEHIDENKEIVVAVFSESRVLPLVHVHIKRNASSASIRIPCMPRLRVEAYLCRVDTRRPPLRSSIVVHRDPSRPRLLIAEHNGKRFLVELLPGAGLHLHSSGPVLKKRGSLLLIERVLISRSYRVICIDRSSPIGRLLAALRRLLHVLKH